MSLVRGILIDEKNDRGAENNEVTSGLDCLAIDLIFRIKILLIILTKDKRYKIKFIVMLAHKLTNIFKISITGINYRDFLLNTYN